MYAIKKWSTRYVSYLHLNLVAEQGIVEIVKIIEERMVGMECFREMGIGGRDRNRWQLLLETDKTLPLSSE